MLNQLLSIYFAFHPTFHDIFVWDHVTIANSNIKIKKLKTEQKLKCTN